MVATLLMLSLTDSAWAGWVKRTVEEQSVQTSEPREVRTSAVQTSFDFSDPALIQGKTRRVVTCENWEIQTIQIVQVLVKEKRRGSEVIKTKRQVQGDPRTVTRDTQHTQTECGEEHAPGTELEVFGRNVALGPEGTWTIAHAELRQDHLTRLSRGSASIEVRSTDNTQTIPFPKEAQTWAAGAWGQQRQQRTEQAAQVQQLDEQAHRSQLAALPEKLQSYRGDWELAWEQAAIDAQFTITAKRPAEVRVATKRGSALPNLVARCSSEGQDLFVELDTRVQAEIGLREIVTVTVRLGTEEPRDLQLVRSGDREAVFFNQPREWLAKLAPKSMLFFRFTPEGATPVDTSFDLDGFDEVWTMLRTACPDP